MTARLLIDPHALRRARLEAAMSQRELAEAAGVSPTTVNGAENGTDARPETIRRLATALSTRPTAIAKIIDR